MSPESSASTPGHVAQAFQANRPRLYHDAVWPAAGLLLYTSLEIADSYAIQDVLELNEAVAD